MTAANRHIILINHTRSVHGAERICLETAQACLERNWRVTMVVSSVFKDEGFEALVEERIMIVRLPYRNLGKNGLRSRLVELYNLPAVVRLCRYIRKEKACCIYSNTFTTILGAWCAQLTHRRHIWHFHEPVSAYYGYAGSIRGMIKRWVKKASQVVFICQKQQKEWEREWQEKCSNGCVVYNPIRELPKTGTMSSDKIRIGYIGSLEERKNITWLVESIERLPKEKISWKIYGGEKDDVENHIYARTSHPEQVYAQLDILVVPSWSETMPLVVMEAMQYGVCVVQTNQSGMGELLTDGEQCVFVDPYKKESLGNALERCMDDTYRTGIAQRGKAWVEKQIRENKYRQQITQILDE